MKQTAKPAEADLVRLAKAGEKAAMAEIYETTYPELWRTARALVKNENDAADILQDAYLKAFTHLDGLSDPAALRPWLRQIAANTARDSLRRSRPLLFSELSDDESPFPDLPEEDVAVLPEPALDQKETSRLVRETMKDLTDGQRLVMGLYYYEDRPVKAIAETLELSENTVKGQLCSGRKKVEARLRALEEKGVRLFGLAPMAFFRALLRTRGEQLQQAAPARAMKRLAAEGPSALVSGTVRAVGAGAQLVKKVIVAAAAVAALGGAIWGIGALARQRQPDPPDQIPETTLVTWDPDVPRTIPALTAVIGGPMLDNDCGDYEPPIDNGSRTVEVTLSNCYEGDSIPGYFGDPRVVDVRSYDLSNSGIQMTEPEIRLEREPFKTSFEKLVHPETCRSEPVTDEADRAYLIGILRDTEFTPDKQTNFDSDNCVKLYIGEDVCFVCPDDTVVCDRGVGVCDFLHVSALAWKYDTQSIRDTTSLIALFKKNVYNKDDTTTEIIPEMEHYKLCITGPELHMDLDREAAEQMFRTVLDLPLMMEPSQDITDWGINNYIELTLAPIDWEPSGTPICLTEYLKGEKEWFVDNLYKDDEEHMGIHQYWFYPDGTIAVLKGLEQARQFSVSSMKDPETSRMKTWYDQIDPQWPRPSICPNAFDWNTLIAELEKLAG